MKSFVRESNKTRGEAANGNHVFDPSGTHSQYYTN